LKLYFYLQTEKSQRRIQRVSIHDDGENFVNGNKTNLKRWKSDPMQYSNLHGRVQPDVSNKAFEQALHLRGFL